MPARQMEQGGRKAGAVQEEAGINFIVFGEGRSLFPTLVCGRLIAE